MLNKVECCSGPGYASPQEALKAPREKVVYTVCIYTEVILKNRTI